MVEFYHPGDEKRKSDFIKSLKTHSEKIVNNREKGVCDYNILENGILSYSGDDKCSINAIKITMDGRMSVADDGTSISKCQIYNFRIQKK